jgi:hypothetical protein
MRDLPGFYWDEERQRYFALAQENVARDLSRYDREHASTLATGCIAKHVHSRSRQTLTTEPNHRTAQDPSRRERPRELTSSRRERVVVTRTRFFGGW